MNKKFENIKYGDEVITFDFCGQGFALRATSIGFQIISKPLTIITPYSDAGFNVTTEKLLREKFINSLEKTKRGKK